MDARIKTFAAEARQRFDFLLDAGFSEPLFHGPEGHPVVLTLTYARSGARVDVSLVLAHMGEEDVSTTLRTATAHIETGPTTAHTAYQMRRALDHQAAAIRMAL
ncbi:hypothetical protein OG394_26095 [Kribbella sp. NBC_01245]|uniref:hypothetical protein n=1 Tax=Kribbella sp. NBC_01245 TaxID=2903578 RepID=UPI002E2C633F|nr:hypothetical protein [Kribbella sp. NBC_01245]